MWSLSSTMQTIYGKHSGQTLLCARHINCKCQVRSDDDLHQRQTLLSSSSNYQGASPEYLRLFSSQSERHRAAKYTRQNHWLLTFWHQTRTGMGQEVKAHGKQRTTE